MSNYKTANEYTLDLLDSLKLLIGSTDRYSSVEGAKLIARDYGAGLADSPHEEAMKEMRNSYISLCVLAYNLNPPIDAKVWNQEVLKGYEKWRVKN